MVPFYQAVTIASAVRNTKFPLYKWANLEYSTKKKGGKQRISGDLWGVKNTNWTPSPFFKVLKFKSLG